jgi:hypothetical protein
MNIMEAIRQIVKVNNKTVTIVLPDDFLADEVEVIILPKEDDFILTEAMKETLDNRVNEDKATYLTAEDSITKLRNKHGI